MSRVQEFIRVLDDPSHPTLEGTDPLDAALLSLVAHVFFADNDLAEAEVEKFSRLCPDDDDVNARIHELRGVPIDVEALKSAFPTMAQRGELFDLCEKAVWGDDKVEHGEMDMVEKLMKQLGFDA